MKKTLGGDRLGAGKKMQVYLHGYERSTHDMGYLWRSSAAPGTLIPFLVELGLPGDTFDIGLNCDVKTHPSLGPLFGSFKVQLDIFQAPLRLYQGLLHNNKLGIGMDMSKVLLPQIRKKVLPINEASQPTPPNLLKDIDNSQINPSALLSYLGLRGFGAHVNDILTTEIIREFNAIPLLAYWEIYKNYYANKQEDEGAYLHTPAPTNPNNIDEVVLKNSQPGSPFIISSPTTPQLPVYIFGPDSEVILTYTGAALDRALDWIIFEVSDTIGGASRTYTWNQLIETWTNDGIDTVSGSPRPTVHGMYIIEWRYKTQADLSTEPPQIVRFSLESIDNMRDEILHSDYDLKFIIDDTKDAPYGPQLKNINQIPATLSSQEGLGLKTYQSDLFNNWLKTEWIDGSTGVNAITAIDTSGGSFTLDTLNLSKKVYEMLNRIAVSGGTYDDWLDVQYGHERYTRVESPMYHGGLSKEIVFQEVISQTASPDAPLGTLGGRGVMSKKHKGGKVIVRVDEPSYIIGIVSITPRLDYSQGNKWDTQLKTMNDLHVPALDEIGFQELITEQMAWWDTQYDYSTFKWTQFSAGKQPAWLNYMTNVNQTRGNFAVATNEMFMTLNRRWEADQLALTTGVTSSIINDLTTYIDPSKYNFIFAETALDAQNFWIQIAIDMEARRKMSAKVMPNL